MFFSHWQQIRDRIDRAESQRMYMIDQNVVDKAEQKFTVLGPTGNVIFYYNYVTIFLSK